MLSSYLRPFKVGLKNLKRVGPLIDGGYVIHKESINLTKKIITLGLNDDWEFEKNFIKLNKTVKVEAYDHTVDNKFWLKRFQKDIIYFFLLKKLKLKKILDIFKYVDYYFFFKKHKHHQKKIGNLNRQIDLKKIFKNLKDDNSVFLKIDIENSEYQICNQIKNIFNSINTLVIEFHDIHKKKNKKKLKKFIMQNKKLKLIHIHGNNYAGCDKLGNPKCIELTFVNSDCIKVKKQLSNLKYPIKNLDFPNLKRRKDININFD